MKCCACGRTQEIASEIDNPVHKSKQTEIQNLQQEINLKRIKYNQALERNYGTTSNQNMKSNQPSNPIQVQSNSLPHLISSIATKQNTLAKIKKLKHKIQQKKSILEQHKKQRNQKFILLQKAQNHLNAIKAQSLSQFQQKIDKIKQEIQLTSQILQNSSKMIKMHFKQTFGKDLASILSIHRMFRLRESEKMFQIKKNDELDYEKMNHSFYDIENIEQIVTKLKSSEKGIHIMFQNVIILQIVQRIFKLWLPYPIEKKINLGLSKLIGSHQDIRICGRKLIDYSKTEKIQNIIIQYFDQSTHENIKSQQTVNVEEQKFQEIKPEFDESIQFNTRIYALSKDFINFMQMNVEYLSIKFGIPKRPLVYFQSDLMKAIQKQFLWRLCWFESINSKPCPSQYYETGYESMLKELKVIKLIESLENMHSMKMTQECVESDKAISEEAEGEQQGQQKQDQGEKKGQTIFSSYYNSFSRSYYDSISKLFYQKQNDEQPEVPSSLENFKSDSTDNDIFQPLQPQANQ